MGAPIEEGEKGDDCPVCTPEIWEPGHTPKYLMVMISGVVKCPVEPPPIPDPPNGDWILTQNPVNPCVWEHHHADFHLVYQIAAIQTSFVVFGIHNILAFSDVVPDLCWAYFASTLACGVIQTYAEGTAFIDLYDFPGTAYQLMVEYGLNTAEKSKFDVHEVPGEPPYVQVRRFGNIRTPMNIAIKTDATHKDQYETFEK